MVRPGGMHGSRPISRYAPGRPTWWRLTDQPQQRRLAPTGQRQPAQRRDDPSHPETADVDDVTLMPHVDRLVHFRSSTARASSAGRPDDLGYGANVETGERARSARGR
jgi:hypothetical protein